MKKIAIVGTGIAGMGCGYFLHRDYDLTFYEQNDYIGGHTNTVNVDENGTQISIDTGFMVYNEVTYPNLTRLFRELDVPTKLSSMSFSVQHVPSGLEFCGSGINGLFAQRRNFVNPTFLSMLRQIHRFNAEAPETLNDARYSSYSLQEYVTERRYGSNFLSKYLVPMSSAVWSTPPDLMLGFPATTLVRFFWNHGFLGLNVQHPWRTIVNGSQTYRQKLIKPFADRIHTRRAAVKIRREKTLATVHDSSGTSASYDKVILACHGDQALRILADPTDLETRLLKPFTYQKNRATLHTDSSLMPKARRAWSSWNYRMDSNGNSHVVPTTIYYMNSLQQVSQKQNYFVSINDSGKVRDEKILWQMDYEHPVYSLDAIRAQAELPKLNENGTTFFCGSYFQYGFHEDAFTSALNVARKLTGNEIWQ